MSFIDYSQFQATVCEYHVLDIRTGCSHSLAYVFLNERPALFGMRLAFNLMWLVYIPSNFSASIPFSFNISCVQLYAGNSSFCFCYGNIRLADNIRICSDSPVRCKCPSKSLAVLVLSICENWAQESHVYYLFNLLVSIKLRKLQSSQNPVLTHILWF